MRFDDGLCGGKAQLLLCADPGEALPANGVPGERCDLGECGGDEVAILPDGPPCTPREVVFGVAPARLGRTPAPQLVGDDGKWDEKEPFTDDDADGGDDDEDDFFPDDADDEDDDQAADDDDEDDFE